MSKRIAFYALHYGKEYLAWSIRSIQDAVDEVHIVYSEKPSFGHSTKARCPDTEDELREQAHRFANVPIYWHKGEWKNEGAHRSMVGLIAAERSARMILVVDADELWAPGQAADAMNIVERDRRPGRAVRVAFVHFWRSFDWVCIDGAMPERIIDMCHKDRGPDRYLSSQEYPVYHFGYAQSEEIMRYKWQIHGHQNELRKGWMRDKFLNWNPSIKDVHPTCADGFWSPEPTGENTKSVLHKLLNDHPYWGKEIIR